MTDSQPNPSRLPLLGLLAALLYALFTLLPDSHSLMVSWPWVLIWQVTLLCPLLWFIALLWQQGQVRRLGHGWDWWILAAIATLILSSFTAEFPQQARWYGIAAFGGLIALYPLHDWLHSGDRRRGLLIAQGYLHLTFILISLGLWLGQTVAPELARLAELRQQFGIQLPFDFSTIDLRNWAPIGHQNYVAGYLLLALPGLLGLGLMHQGWQRWFWLAGLGLGLVDLYTTSSRGGWLGLMAWAIAAFIGWLVRSRLPRWQVAIAGLAGCGVLGGLLLFNNRLVGFLQSFATGRIGDELAYRLITLVAGWQMGLSHPWFGAGLGVVPVAFQKYRPAWAGREAELAYQLHSTPVQIWAELGLAGVGLMVTAIALLLLTLWRSLRQTRHPQERILITSLASALFAYSINSLTDYQLDNLSISGNLVLTTALLIASTPNSELQTPHSQLPTPNSSLTKLFPFLLTGLTLALSLWLLPVHRAWSASATAFIALAQLEATNPPPTAAQQQAAIAQFRQSLQQAIQLAPWEPYYHYQLGWNLGDLGLKNNNTQLIPDAIAAFRQGIGVSPYQEFGYSNLAWLIINQNPKAATDLFAKAARLVPGKRGMFYGLGYGLLAQGKLNQAVEAITLEALRDPILITSPIWRSPAFQPLYTRVLDRLVQHYTSLLQDPQTDAALKANWQLCRGSIEWWRGNWDAARADWTPTPDGLQQKLLDLGMGKPLTQAANPNGEPGEMAIAAWFNPTERLTILQKAWVKATHTAPPPGLVEQLATSMTTATTVDQWLKTIAPPNQYRRERAGFGVLSRHIDGPIPRDYLTIVDNVILTQFFADLFPTTVYTPVWDKLLQVEREKLLAQVSGE